MRSIGYVILLSALALQAAGTQTHTGKHLRKHKGTPAPTDIYCWNRDQLGVYGVNESLQHDQRYDACGQLKADETWSYFSITDQGRALPPYIEGSGDPPVCAGCGELEPIPPVEPWWSCVGDIEDTDHHEKYRMCSKVDPKDESVEHRHIVKFEKWDGKEWHTFYTSALEGCPVGVIGPCIWDKP